jgi:acyl-CoA dehydrogenase
MDFTPSPQVETLRERILDFMDAEIYPQEREIMEALDAEVAPGVPFPRILVEIREKAKHGTDEQCERWLEPLLEV